MKRTLLTLFLLLLPACSDLLGDQDGDGFVSCDDPRVAEGSDCDCDDGDAEVSPKLPDGSPRLDLCDFKDNNCIGGVDEDGPPIRYYLDEDKDGPGDSRDRGELSCTPVVGRVKQPDDCNDSDPLMNPDEEEVCDGKDNDCDNTSDESGEPPNWYLDQDGDKYGTETIALRQCSPPAGYVLIAGDCDDTDPAFHPNAPEECDTEKPDYDIDYNCDKQTGIKDHDGDKAAACSDCNDQNAAISPNAEEVCDGLDNDCSGAVDDVSEGNRWRDRDNDHYSPPDADVISLFGCVAGWTDTAPKSDPPSNQDCDDNNPYTYPGALELCDGQLNNCNGQLPDDEADLDGDGVPICSLSGLPPDCNDNPADSGSIQSPLLPETCDGLDSDCDGLIPETELDADSDSFRACDDCDDTRPEIYPLALETCDGLDNNCDGTLDEGLTVTVYPDADGDGYGDAATPLEVCVPTSDQLNNSYDCNDQDSGISPRALEIGGDGLDNNCNGEIDETSSCLFPDSDGDGFGTSPCKEVPTQTPGCVAAEGDCDDTTADISPNASETCDERDNDCDGSIDEGVTTHFYPDGDNDGYGIMDPEHELDACFLPDGSSALAGDCEDGDDLIHPDALEICGNDIDENCDGSATDAGVSSTWYRDSDGDLYGDPTQSIEACVRPEQYVSRDGDCDDTTAKAFPNNPEICDGIDNNCDGAVDNDASNMQTYYLDADGDTYGDLGNSIESCEMPDNTVENNLDCDDSDQFTFPGTEGCLPVKTSEELQAAIEEAEDGAVVQIAAGTIHGHITLLNKNIMLQGLGAPDETILSGDGQPGSVIQIVGGNVTLENLTITGGTGTSGKVGTCYEESDSRLSAGGGICARSTTLTGRNLILSGNSANSGGEVFILNSSTTLSGLQLTGGSGVLEGGGLYQSGGSLLLSDSEISGYSGSIHGAGLYSYYGALTLERVTLERNTASSVGGGLYFIGNSQALKLTDVTFIGNMATVNGGGAFVQSSGAVTLHNLHFKENISSSGGGASLNFNSGSNLIATDLDFTGNLSSSSGAGLYLALSSGSVSTWKGLTFSDNAANTEGGEMQLSGSPASALLEGLNFSGNRSGTSGGGLHAYLSSNTTLRHLTLTDSAASNYGGALCLTGDGVVEDVVVSGARATNGGGVYLSGSTRVNRLTITGARATSGGGILCESSSAPVLRNLQVLGNEATAYGGGIHFSNGNCQVYNATVVRNRSWQNGGGVAIGGSALLSNSIVAYNGATIQGSSVYASGTSFSVTDSLLYNPPIDGNNLYGISPFILQNYRILQVEPRFIRDVRYGVLGAVDLHLRPDSPARNMGSGGSGDNDPDGSRNDMGAFGGPASSATDNDSDGLPDDWEAQYGLLPDTSEAGDDPDGDGLTNADEYASGLVPSSPDSDGDGVDDDVELFSGTHPLDPFDATPGEAPAIEVPAQLSTVQSALDSAFPETVIRLAPGTYLENLHTAFKPLTLEGASGRDQTILKGDGTQTVLVLHGMEEGTVLRDLTVTGGNGASRYGGGIFAQWSIVSMSDLAITGNSADYGGGMYLASGTCSISRTVIKGNSAYFGGGLYQSLGTSNITHTVLEGNSASGETGGGIRNDGGTFTLKHSILAFNTCSIGAYSNWYNTCPTAASSHNLYFFSSGEDGSTCPLSSTDLVVDPLFLDRANGDYHLASSSPLINAGDPHEDELDPDGSPADIGLYGGPGADEFDFDGDGSPAYFWPGGYYNPDFNTFAPNYDCDDLDGEVYPGEGC